MDAISTMERAPEAPETAASLARRCKELAAKIGPTAYVYASTGSDQASLVGVYPLGQGMSNPRYFRGARWDEMFAAADAWLAAIPDPEADGRAEYASWDMALLRPARMAAE